MSRLSGKLSLCKILNANKKQMYFRTVSLFFHKKSRCPAINGKRDALIEMETPRKTPRNDAGKSYEANPALDSAGVPKRVFAGMRLKTTNDTTILKYLTTSKLQQSGERL